MSKWLYNILFVMITIFFVFIGIENVDAKDYSYINCTYTWKADVINENTKTFSLKVNYNTKGKLVMDDSVTYTRKYPDPSYKCANYNCSSDPNAKWLTETKKLKIIKVGIAASDFVKGQNMKGICPGNGDLDLYIDLDNKKVYAAWTEKELKNYISKNNISGGEYDKARLTTQNGHQGDTTVVNGQEYTTEKGITCKYNGKYSRGDSLSKVEGSLTLVIASNGTILSSSAFDNKFISRADGFLSGRTCPKKIGVSGQFTFDGVTLDSIRNIAVYRDRDAGNYTFELDEKSLEENSDNSPYPIVLSDTNGCAMWGSLLKLLKNDIFGLLKYSLIGFLIVLGMLDFSKAMFSGEEKEIKQAASKLIKRIIVVIVIFLLPLLIETIIDLILSGEGIDVETCISDF